LYFSPPTLAKFVFTKDKLNATSIFSINDNKFLCFNSKGRAVFKVSYLVCTLSMIQSEWSTVGEVELINSCPGKGEPHCRRLELDKCRPEHDFDVITRLTNVEHDQLLLGESILHQSAEFF